MTLSWDLITRLLIASLSSEERESSVIYLDERRFPAESAVEIDGVETRLSEPAMIAFIDLDPIANWGHRCRYLVVNPETGNLQEMPAQFPPFMRDYPETLRVIWTGVDVPEWAVAHPPPRNIDL